MADNSHVPAAQSVVKLIPVEHILPSRHQARKDFPEERIKSLAASIEDVGLIELISVFVVPTPNPVPEGVPAEEAGGEWYELIAGECRWRAYKLKGWKTIEAIIRPAPIDAVAAAMGLYENIQRQSLNPIEEGEGFDHLNKLDQAKYTHEKITADIGKDRSYVTYSIGLLLLPEPVKDNVRRRTLPRSHALELLGLPSDDLKVKAAQEIIAKDLSILATRQLIAKMTVAGDKAGAGKPEQASKKGNNGGVHIYKAGKNIRIEAVVPADTPTDAIAKASTDEHQKFIAEQNQPKARPVGPDPEALKAARAEDKANKADIARITNKIASLKTAVSGLVKGGIDPAGTNQEIDKLKAELQALKAKKPNPILRQASKAQAAKKPKGAKILNDQQNKSKIPNKTITDQAKLEQIQKQAEAFKKGDWVEALKDMPPAIQIPQLKGAIAAMTQRMAAPNMPDEQKAALNEQIQKAQARLEELQKSMSVSSPLEPVRQSPTGGGEGKGEGTAVGEVEEQKKKMLELVNSGKMSPADMAGVKSQYEAMIPETQQKLSSPGIDEAESARLKAWIQMMQEVNEAIKKKLGGQ